MDTIETKELIVGSTDERLDRFLTANLPQYSRAYFQRLIKQGNVQVNQTVELFPSCKLKAGSKVSIDLIIEKTEIMPEDIKLTIIYEDSALLVVDKPAGLVVHPAAGHLHGTLLNAVISHLNPDILKDTKTFNRPGIVHRLDKDTSGLLVIAKTPQAFKFLAKQFENRKIQKTYLAIVTGEVKAKEGLIKGPIGRSQTNRINMTITPEGRESTTSFQVKEITKNYTLLEVKPLTGRTHQIRVHLSQIGHAVWGDKQYHSEMTGEPNSQMPERQMLHAYKLRFQHPETKKPVEFTAPIPQDFKEVWEILKKA